MKDLVHNFKNKKVNCSKLVLFYYKYYDVVGLHFDCRS